MRTRYCAARTGATVAALIIVCATAALAMQLSSSDEPPIVVTAVAPSYPPIAVAVNAGGTVITEVEVNAAGEVITALGTSGHPLLRRAAENTARRWRFTPAAVTRMVRLTFIFRIMPRETTADELTPVFRPPYQVEVRHQPAEPIIHSDPPS